MSEEENIKKSIEKLKSNEILKKKELNNESPDLNLEKNLEKLSETNIEQKRELSEEISSIVRDDENGSSGIVVQTDRRERGEKIEEFLALGLEDIYLKMDVVKQQEFKQKGEETASEINELLGKTKIKIKKIVALIRKWLSIIPGVSKFFLEKEAKMRADKIIKLKKND